MSVVGQTGVPADVVLRPPDPTTALGPFVEMRAPSTRLSAVTLKGPWPRSVGCAGPTNLGLNGGLGIGVLVANGPVRFADASVIDHVALRQVVSSGCPTAAVGVQVGTGGGPLRGRAIVRNSLWTGYGNAVVISDDSQATIVDNVLRNTGGFCQPSSGRCAAGIAVAGIKATRATVNIERNDVSGFLTAFLDGCCPFVLSKGVVLGPGARGTVADNDIHNSWIGLFVDAQGLVVSNNAVHDSFEVGIQAAATSSGNRFLHNVATNNGGSLGFADCVDDSARGVTGGSANNWVDNIGAAAFPPDICAPPAP